MIDLSAAAETVAEQLLGSEIVREIQGHRIVGRIVETEAYDQFDAASHSYRGRTPRTEVMFGPPGRAYVYFTYGRHFCMNVVTGPDGYGSAVLIRALEIVEGLALARTYRPRAGSDLLLANGPAKLCQALNIGRELNGHDLSLAPLMLRLHAPLPGVMIRRSTRIGISKDTARLWRFSIIGNRYVS